MAKDITLSVIGATGTAGGTGYVIEYCGEAIRDLSMEGRMTVCRFLRLPEDHLDAASDQRWGLFGPWLKPPVTA